MDLGLLRRIFGHKREEVAEAEWNFVTRGFII
jgi:hypothetical protein